MINYFIEYCNEEDIYQNYGKNIKGVSELIVLNGEIVAFYEKTICRINKDNLIRTYIIQAQPILFSDIKERYKSSIEKEWIKMKNAKEKCIIDEIEEEISEYSDDALFNITSFGADMSFRELITMYEEGDLEKPEMQRNYVWNKNEASRFIDSILLGLPVPSIFLAKTSDEKRLIVDGYQRIMTVFDYVKRGIFGGDGKSFSLSNSENINERWRGKTFQELQPEEQRKIRNSSIHAIVFEQKEPKDDTGMYQIFERINTSGRSLKPQEIRNCVYHSKFNSLLIELNKNENWRKIFGMSESEPRMADIELLLRMFAFSDLHNRKENKQKQINLVKYLNTYMKYNSELDNIPENELREEFEAIIEFFFKRFDNHIFRNGKYKDGEVVFSNKINPAIVDAVYSATLFTKKQYGLDSIVEFDLNKKYEMLIRNADFQEAISKRTTNIENIRKRAKIAAELLYGVSYEW
jgi:hypothetical protein